MEPKIKIKVEKYLKNAEDMFENLEVAVPREIDIEKVSKEFMEMALSYYEDAKHFYSKKEYENALAALEYAEGWLDAGKKLGIFKKK